MSVPVYRRVTGSANQINVTSVYRHTVCYCERASVLAITPGPPFERHNKSAQVRRCSYRTVTTMVQFPI